MNTENRITGPGYYPRRPTPLLQCMKPTTDIPGYQWFGWAEYDVPKLQELGGVSSYVFVLAKLSRDAEAYGRRLYTEVGRAWSSPYLAPIEPSFNHTHFQACLEMRRVALHWPDGSWQVYENKVATSVKGRVK